MPSNRKPLGRRSKKPRAEDAAAFVEGAGTIGQEDASQDATEAEGLLSGKQEGEKAPVPAAAEGRAHNAHTEPYSKQSVVLFNRQVAYLQRLKADVQLKTGRKISLSEMIRALVDALEQSGVDVTETGTEEAMAELLTKRLRG